MSHTTVIRNGDGTVVIKDSDEGVLFELTKGEAHVVWGLIEHDDYDEERVDRLYTDDRANREGET